MPAQSSCGSTSKRAELKRLGAYMLQGPAPLKLSTWEMSPLRGWKEGTLSRHGCRFSLLQRRNIVTIRPVLDPEGPPGVGVLGSTLASFEDLRHVSVLSSCPRDAVAPATFTPRLQGGIPRSYVVKALQKRFDNIRTWWVGFCRDLEASCSRSGISSRPPYAR